jgi:hypothetical protein
MWILTVLTSEFFWGVIVGLVLSVLGAYYLGLHPVWMTPA